MRHAAQKPLTIISNDGGDAAEAAEAVSVPEEEAADTGDHTSRLPADSAAGDGGQEEEAAAADTGDHASRLPADTAAGSDAPEDNGDDDDEAAAERPWQPRKRQRKELLLR
ncbi:MAG: hypothetical protein II922_06390 [Succinimonas sp.]|nr:hypothetical protein [Succinimonas sp.]